MSALPPLSDGAALEFHERVSGWLQGHLHACVFIETLCDLAHAWDDLTDHDHPLHAASVHQAFWDALIVIPSNPFYIQNFSLLNGLVKQAILNWHIANKMEVSGDELDTSIAFILRSSYADLITACACIIGGEKWAIQVGYEVRRQASREGYLLYLERLRDERRTFEGASNGTM